MEEDKVIVQPSAKNDTTCNTLLKITQQNALDIQILEKEMDIIKRNTPKYDNGNE